MVYTTRFRVNRSRDSKFCGVTSPNMLVAAPMRKLRQATRPWEVGYVFGWRCKDDTTLLSCQFIHKPHYVES